jgi:Domain of unknown function (DUF5655)
MPALPPLWRCDLCGETFVNKNAMHSCGRFSLDALFAKSEPHVRAMFERLQAIAIACGPIHTIPQKTRVVFQVRMRFLALYPRKASLLCGFVLARRVEHPRFEKILSVGPRSHVHDLRLTSVDEIDADVRRWMREAYASGEQQHLAPAARASARPPVRPLARSAARRPRVRR